MNDLIAVPKIAGWQKLKAMVLDGVSSPITKRVYNMAMEEFLAWFQEAPRPGFTKATVSAWQVYFLNQHQFPTTVREQPPLCRSVLLGILTGRHASCSSTSGCALPDGA